ncbi:Integral membrane efflux protein [Frankia canadensis]|uniref:Integral membrane efflux protein n=1 Tax=Frankia canadensis TaxID=1836972 RepID=A0A2I2L205_9ACTN|nr:MFS transporter [Frankia canadensis]SNQ51935.1 Integral membrane efflux protein [Frankia canadensis]SOU59225.1 Integral membrane efflux protein [Frankia canadensis]
MIGGVFRSLRVHNFRLFAGGQVLSVTGTWMMFTAQDWLVLSLSHDSGSALALVTALQFTPVMLLTLYGGRLADRYDKRHLLTGANLVAGVLSTALALLVFTGAVRLWQVCLFALGIGLVNAVEMPTRMAFISELVGPELLPNASALSAAYFNTARVLGPAAAGPLIAAFGTGPAMTINAGSYLATVVGLRLMRPGEIRRHRRAAGEPAPRVVDGLRYVRGRADLVVVFGLVATVGLFGMNFQLTVPLLARTVFHAGATSFGLLTTGLAAGSLLAAFVTTGRRTRPSAWLVIGWAGVFGLVEAAAGCAPSYPVAIALLAVTGFAMLYFMQAANHRIQLGSDPAFRGRVMALYALILQGTTPLGAALVGGLTDAADARAGLYVGGLLSALAALAAAVAHRSWASAREDRAVTTAEPESATSATVPATSTGPQAEERVSAHG